MKNSLIQLTPTAGEFKYYINSQMICSISEYKDFCVIQTMDGKSLPVKELLQEINSLIKKSETYSITTY